MCKNWHILGIQGLAICANAFKEFGKISYFKLATIICSSLASLKHSWAHPTRLHCSQCPSALHFKQYLKRTTVQTHNISNSAQCNEMILVYECMIHGNNPDSDTQNPKSLHNAMYDSVLDASTRGVKVIQPTDGQPLRKS